MKIFSHLNSFISTILQSMHKLTPIFNKYVKIIANYNLELEIMANEFQTYFTWENICRIFYCL